MNTSQVNGSLNKTEDLSIFKFREDNRAIDPTHVRKLVASMEGQNDLHLNPIIVTPDLEVIDGQHRLTAARELGYPVWYVIDENYRPEKMIGLNTTQKSWRPEDFLKYWIAHGRTDYQKLHDFHRDIGFTLALILRWQSEKRKGIFEAFKQGQYEFIMDKKILKGIFATKQYVRALKETNFKPAQIYIQGAFHEACRHFFCSDIVDPDRFFERLELCPYKLKYTNQWQDYLQQMATVYNYDLRKDRVRVIQDGPHCELAM